MNSASPVLPLIAGKDRFRPQNAKTHLYRLPVELLEHVLLLSVESTLLKKPVGIRRLQQLAGVSYRMWIAVVGIPQLWAAIDVASVRRWP